MNIVLITGKRSMRNLDTVLKKSEQAVTVGKYTSVRPNTATEIYEKVSSPWYISRGRYRH